MSSSQCITAFVIVSFLTNYYDLLNKNNSPSSVPSVMKLPMKTQKKMAMMFPGCHSFPVEGLMLPL
jgi:hypothetical protein